jgi:baseplate J-like protein
MDDRSCCGCCEGADKLPQVRDNAPGLPAVTYRVGTHASFKAALLARLSSTAYPALAELRTRRDDDFTIAACDAAATLLDVLTFYQERYANEFYLRTATERRSIVELARLIGYQPSPGVAAATRLAFQLEDAPGIPSLAAEPVTIAVGTKVQSVPGPGEEPQTFETVEEVTARVEWNAIPVQTTERQTFAIGTTKVFLEGVSVQVQSGDVILIVGDERTNAPASTDWDARVVAIVERDSDLQLTRVTLSSALGDAPITPAQINPRAYVFRQRAALFGHNAPDPKLLFNGTTAPSGMTEADAGNEWANYWIPSPNIDLDTTYPKVLVDSWLLLAGGDDGQDLDELPGLVDLLKITNVRHKSRSAFALTGRITRLNVDKTDTLGDFPLMDSAAFVQSEELPLTDRPLNSPLYGATLGLQRLSVDLVRKQPVVVTGRRQRVRLIADDENAEFHPDDGGSVLTPKANDSFTLASPPAQLLANNAEGPLTPAELAAMLDSGSDWVSWHVIDDDGRSGLLYAAADRVALEPAHKDDPLVGELCVIADTATAVVNDRDRTTLELGAPLINVYDRSKAFVCANIVRATHGETVSEVAGSGDAAAVGQSFMLKQSPLTYVSAATPDGRESTLEVRVNGLKWAEVPSLFEQEPAARVYALRQDGDGKTIAQFGDGVEGARLPSGQDNIRFTYRKGLGSAGNLDAGRLTTLLGRPLGVKSATNFIEATAGEDEESLDDGRSNAPLTMLTLGRAVSLQDYADFARSFAGITRAQAVWIGSGTGRGIFVSVAGPGGAAVEADSDTMINLMTALRRYGDPLVPLTVQSYADVPFTLEAQVAVAEDADADEVLTHVEQALRDHYSFDARDFGQIVSIDEVMSVIQGVTGIEGVDINALYRLDSGPSPDPDVRLYAFPAQLHDDGTVTPAEMLTIDSGPLLLGVMP